MEKLNLAGQLKIGEHKVNRLGLGTNRIGDNERSRQILNYAVQAGVNFIDTAELYGQSQQVIGETLAPYKSGVIVATKGGYSTNDPSVLQNGIDMSLGLLNMDRLPLWQLHRVHPDNSFEETLKFMKSQLEAGKVENMGLSEVTVEQVKAARKIVPIVSVQNHYNLETRQHEEVVDYCSREEIIFMPFFPLSSGGAAHDAKLQDVAKKHGAKPVQIAIAWLLKRSPMMLPIPGTLSPEHLDENLAAASIDLSDADFNSLNA